MNDEEDKHYTVIAGEDLSPDGESIYCNPLSEKAFNVLEVIIRGNPDGSRCDMDELLQRINYHTSKDSMQFTIRALVKRKLIQKAQRQSRRGRSRVVFVPTSFGYEYLQKRKGLNKTNSKELVEIMNSL